ncbi:MAG TPA: hypothetical protein VIJ34_06160 [Acidimicrobiales bacterium]
MNQADKLAMRFEEHEPDAANFKEGDALRHVRQAFQRRAASERELGDAVRVARDARHSWAAIGSMLGTSGEAARQRYGSPPATRGTSEKIGSAEIEFHREVLAGTAALKKKGYDPIRFLEMVHESNGRAAAKRLLRDARASDGFTTLWEMHMLEMSVEAMALLPWYSPLFDPEELATAQKRLIDYGFDLSLYLARAAATPPVWAQ